MGLSGTVSEINDDSVENRKIFPLSLRGLFLSEFCNDGSTVKTRMTLLARAVKT